MNTLIILCAKYLIIASPLLVGAFWLTLDRESKKRLALRVIVGGGLSFALAKLAGHLYYDPRPFVTSHITPLVAHASDNGFPSDHTLLATALAFAVLTISRSWGSGLLVLAALIGASRVAAGIHHPLDILGSFVVSGVALAVVIAAERVFASLKKSPKPGAEGDK